MKPQRREPVVLPRGSNKPSLGVSDILFFLLSGALLLFSIYLRWNNHRRTTTESAAGPNNDATNEATNNAAENKTNSESSATKANKIGAAPNATTSKDTNVKQRRKKKGNKKQ